jgi:hypothetical protein
MVWTTQILDHFPMALLCSDVHQYRVRVSGVSVGVGIVKGDVVIGFEVAVGFLIAWVVRKMGRVGRRVDTEVDQVLDAGLDRLHDVVAAKLGGDPALEKLRSEAGESGEVGPRTQARVRLALEEAVEQDPAFAAEFEAAVAQVQAAQQGGTPALRHLRHQMCPAAGVLVAFSRSVEDRLRW